MINVISNIHQKTAMSFGALKTNFMDVSLLKISLKVNVSLNKGGPLAGLSMNIAIVGFKPLKVV